MVGMYICVHNMYANIWCTVGPTIMIQWSINQKIIDRCHKSLPVMGSLWHCSTHMIGSTVEEILHHQKDDWNPMSHGINHLSAGEGFLSSAVCMWIYYMWVCIFYIYIYTYIYIYIIIYIYICIHNYIYT